MWRDSRASRRRGGFMCLFVGVSVLGDVTSVMRSIFLLSQVLEFTLLLSLDVSLASDFVFVGDAV